MRKLFLTWAAAVAAVALVGCKEDNPEPVPAPVIHLNQNQQFHFFAAGGNGEIKYSIANPVEGVTLHADCEANWVTDVTAGEANVTFNVAENAEEEVRNAEIVLSYDGAEPVKVNVTQASAVYNSFQITVDELLPSTVTLSCVPSDAEATYVFSVMRQSEFDEYGSDQAVIDSDVEYVKENPSRLRKGSIDKEEFSLIYQGVPYVVYAFGVTEEGKVTSKELFKQTFNAPERPSVSFGEVALIPAEGGKVTVSYTVDNPIAGKTITATAGYGVDWIHDINVTDTEISFVADANSAAEPGSDPRTGFISVSYPEAYNASLTFKQASPEKPAFEVSITKLWSNVIEFQVVPADLTCTYVAKVMNASKADEMTDAQIVADDVASFTAPDWYGNPGKIEKKYKDEYGYEEGDLWEGAQTVSDEGISEYVKKYYIIVYGMDLEGNLTTDKIIRIPFETAAKPVITVDDFGMVPVEGGTYTVGYSIENERKGEPVRASVGGWNTDWIHDLVLDTEKHTVTFTVDKNTDTKGYSDYRSASVSISHADASYTNIMVKQLYPEE